MTSVVPAMQSRTKDSGEMVYFWWTILAAFGAGVLTLYGFVVFAMRGDDWRIHLAFGVIVFKLLAIVIGAVNVLSPKKGFLISTLIASSILPCFFLFSLIRIGFKSFFAFWSFDDSFITFLLLIDIVEIVLAGFRFSRIRRPEVTQWPQ